MEINEYSKKIANAYQEIKQKFSLDFAIACNQNRYFMANYSSPNPVRNIDGKIEWGPCIIIDASCKRDVTKSFDVQCKSLFDELNSMQCPSNYLN